MQIENTFGEFIKKYSFVIPDYQTAYAWTEKQLNHHNELSDARTFAELWLKYLGK